MGDYPYISNKYWTRKKVSFGFGIQTFALSSFGSSISHGTILGFGDYGFGQIRFGSAGPGRGPTSSFGKIDNYQGYTGRLNQKCVVASGELASEEIYWQKNIDKRSGCIPKPTKIASHYLNLRRVKINGLTAYIYYRWKKLTDCEKERYKKLARGKRMSGINIFLKEYFAKWGFAKGGFGEVEFGSCHQAPVFYGFSTVAFGMGAFGTHYPEPRRLGFGIQPFGEIRFGSNLRKERKLRVFR